MQNKSYRALKWTLLMSMTAALASACVVSTGDGDDDDITIDGGEGGTAGSKAGSSSGGTKAGSSGSGGTAGSSAGTTSGGTGGSATAGTGGTGGTAAYVPGACESELKTPSMLPSCDAKPDDNDCGACLKVKCCDELQACYGTEPTSACGYGAKSDADNGQFDCIRECYDKNNDGVKTIDEILPDCAAECLNQCEADGLINTDTQDLTDCAVNSCPDECFPPAM